MKYNNTSAFTLVEVIVAASILSVTIFGVYKLIGENTKLISNNENYSFTNTLFPSLQECIEYSWTGWLAVDSTYHFDFWEDGNQCNREDSFTRTINLDNIEYSLSGTITSETNDSYEWDLEVNSDIINSITQSYTQLK